MIPVFNRYGTGILEMAVTRTQHRSRAELTREGAGETADVLDVIELASAVLVRNFELLRRRSDAYTNLDRAEYLLLRTLDQTGPLDICTLAGAVGLDPSTAGRQAAVMQGKGLVERRRDAADRRRSIVCPTSKGHKLMVRTRARRREATAELLAEWADDELRTLARTFTHYNQTVAQRYLSPPRTHPAASPVAAQVLLPEDRLAPPVPADIR